MNKKSLKDIAEIISGHTLQELLGSHNAIGPRFLRASSLGASRDIDDSTIRDLPRLNTEARYAKAYAKDGDILLINKARGNFGFYARIFRSKETDVLVSSTMFVLRLKESGVTPEWLCSYFNSNIGQTRLSSLALGSLIQSISKINLGTVDVPILQKEKQEILVRLEEVVQRQVHLHEIIKQKKIQLVRSAIHHAIN